MTSTNSFKDLSFLVYGLGLTGKSVVSFFKKIKLKTIKCGMTKIRIYLSQKDQII